MGERAADRPAVADLLVGDRAPRPRRPARGPLVGDVGVARHRADADDRRSSRSMPAQARHAPEVDEQRRARRAAASSAAAASGRPRAAWRPRRPRAAPRPAPRRATSGRDVVELGGDHAVHPSASPGSPPTPASGVSGMLMKSTPTGRSASIPRWSTAGARGDRARLADALDAERVDGRRRLGAVESRTTAAPPRSAARSRRTCR